MSVNSIGYLHLGGNIRNIYILLLLSLSFGTVTDIDGNAYETVQIGDQLWMAENLRVTHYNNGDEIPDWYYNNNPSNLETYGRLYSWSTVDDDRGVCPDGFHVPSDEEWTILTDFIAPEGIVVWGNSIAGGKVKEAGSEHWFSPNTGATNESGFTALPAGYRNNFNGFYFNMGSNGYYWSSSESGYNYAWYRLLNYNSSSVYRYDLYKQSGFSIRCLSDETQNTTILVPDNFATIQEAIDYSIDGDTILVSAGTYYENINFNGKNIALIGENRETTIIDGGQNDFVVYIDNINTPQVELNGFTIQNGIGGIFADNYGGESNNVVELINLIIRNNNRENGSAINAGYLNMLIIENCEVYENENSNGGTVDIAWTDSTFIKSSHIFDNLASTGAGIKYRDSGYLEIDNVSLLNNQASSQGGGIFIWQSDKVNITNSDISNNIANRGGAIYISDSELNASNVLITNNLCLDASNNCGAIVIQGQIEYSIDRVTFVNNERSAIHHQNVGSSFGVINNSIFWNPSAAEQISFNGGSYPVMTYSTIYPMSAGNEQYLNYCLVDGWCDNVIFEDPQFNGDYTLQPSSPCIDAGDPNSPLDPDGTRADMGAYPTYQNSIELNAGANLISFYVFPDDKSVTNMLSSLGINATGIIGEGVAASQINGNWSGSLTTIAETSGYWVQISEADELRVFGEPVIGSDVEYELHSGANLVSYPYEDSNSIESALTEDAQANLTGIIGEGVAANNSSESGWMGSLDAFGKNRGYWLIASAGFDMYYNEPTGLSRLSSPTLHTNYSQSSQQAFYFIESIENIEQGDIIHTYSNGINVGSRVWNGGFTDVPAMGDDGSKFTAGYCIDGSIPTFKVEKANGSLITLTGDIPEWSNNQLYMVGYLEESIALPAVYSLSTAYPNPFNPTTTLSFAIPVDSEVSLSIYNLQGREVTSLIDANMDAGYHSIVWDANSYASGVYFVKMMAGEYISTQKLMLIK